MEPKFADATWHADAARLGGNPAGASDAITVAALIVPLLLGARATPLRLAFARTARLPAVGRLPRLAPHAGVVSMHASAPGGAPIEHGSQLPAGL